MPDLPSKTAWDKKNTVGIYLKLNRNTDADILRKLDSQKSKQGYIKSLIKKDMENAGE